MIRALCMVQVAQLNRKLDSKLLNDLMETAVKLRPEVVRDGKGLTEFEFVLGMLLELKVVMSIGLVLIGLELTALAHDCSRFEFICELS